MIGINQIESFAQAYSNRVDSAWVERIRERAREYFSKYGVEGFPHSRIFDVIANRELIEMFYVHLQSNQNVALMEPRPKPEKAPAA